MSRTESHDSYDFPPGLGFVPRPGTNIHNYHQSSVTPLGEFPPIDRRSSLSMGYSSFSPPYLSLPRSIGAHDQDFGIFGNGDSWSATPNRHTPAVVTSQVQQHPSSNPQQRSPPPLNGASANAGNHFYNPSSYNDRENYFIRNATVPSPPQTLSAPAASTTSPNATSLRSTLYWNDLEPWMDEEYAKRVCGLMNWDPVNIKIPHAQPDTITGQQANNPGYCFLTFSSQAQAERVMNQVNPNTGGSVTMPNSSRPFNIKFAASLPSLPTTTASPGNLVPGAHQQYPKEYSIFVGDLAPETSNSDLVAVFRNPVLGLRNDREPKFIRPFLSCKSAKIMLDPVTGVSRGYGFVRFTDEADQQRALIEMHGLYCLSRPMRISPATAKFKPPVAVPAVDLLHVQAPSAANGHEQQSQSVTIALPLPNGGSKSVSAPIAANNSSGSLNHVSSAGSGSSLAASNSVPSLSSGSTTSISSSLASTTSEELLNSMTPNVIAQLAQYANQNGNAKGPNFPQELQQQGNGNGQKYEVSEESWKHHAQARAILGNLIGPNGEQLTSTDPYNTTVFVGGLSPLIGEDTLRSFFTPFGEIHYVKVPVGKHCGFVQFVRKADAERAIESMQGFPIGGSRIRLSWGRSQYKAAQAAAQAAQTTALQAQFQQQTAPPPTTQFTSEQAMQLIQRLALAGVLDAQGNIVSDARSNEHSTNSSFGDGTAGGYEREEKSRFMSGMMELRQNRLQKESNFSPFSPDPNLFSGEKNELPHQPSRNYASAFGPSPLHMHDSKAIGGLNGNNDKVSRLPNMSQRFGSSYLEDPGRRQEAPISRPNSGTPSNGQAAQHDSKEHDAMQDLNGTLANLDLDSQGTWKPLSADSYAKYKAANSSAHGSTPSP